MHYINRIIIVFIAITFTHLANASFIQSNLVDATNGGGFYGVVKIEDLVVDQVRITADISDPINSGLTQGDILGLWFDISDFDTIGSFTGTGNIISLIASLNGVGNSLGGNVNINGSGPAGWDLGIVTGINGAPGGFNQTISIDLTASGLSAMSFLNNRIGMRVQSIEGSSFNAGSSKLLGVVEVSAPAASIFTALSIAVFGALVVRRQH